MLVDYRNEVYEHWSSVQLICAASETVVNNSAPSTIGTKQRAQRQNLFRVVTACSESWNHKLNPEIIRPKTET